EKEVELRRRQLAVLLPPDRLLGVLIADDELVLGRAACMYAGLGAQRAALHHLRLAVPDGVLKKRRLGQIPMDRSQILEAEFIGAVGAVPQTGFLHGIDLQNASGLRRTPSTSPLGGERRRPL